MSAQPPKKAPDFKIVLLGQSSSGKTCLVNRFLRGDFSLQQPTVGMAFVDKSVTVDGRTFRLGIWDTAGSERYMSLTPMYYRGVNVALLCYDVTSPESLGKIRFWFEQLMEHEPGCVVFVAGTKADLLPQTGGEGSALGEQIRAFAEEKRIDPGHTFVTSAKTGSGVNELFASIAAWCYTQLKEIDSNPAPPPVSPLPDPSAPPKRHCCH